MNADSEAALQGLVDRAMNHMERTYSMTDESATQDLQHTESVIRAADTAAHAELRTLRAEVDAAAWKDIDAFAQALVHRQGAPKSTAGRIRERIRDIEVRVIPGTDEALWQFRDRVITVLRPEAEEMFLKRLRAQLRRWAPPKFASDPFNVLPTPRAEHPAHAERPDDIVAWVTNGIERIERDDAEREVQKDRDERQRAMAARLLTAQGAWEREFYDREREEEERSPILAVAHATRTTSPLNPDEFRARWLAKHDPHNDYGYVTPGQVVQVKNDRNAEAPPAPIDRSPEPVLTATEA